MAPGIKDKTRASVPGCVRASFSLSRILVASDTDWTVRGGAAGDGDGDGNGDGGGETESDSGEDFVPGTATL